MICRTEDDENSFNVDIALGVWGVFVHICGRSDHACVVNPNWLAYCTVLNI